MWIQVLLSCLLALAAGLYLYCKKKYSYFTERGVKQLYPLPFVGSWWRSLLYKEHFADSTRKLYNDFPGEKYVGIYEGTKPVVCIRDPEIIKKITVTDFEHFVDHRNLLEKSDDDNLFNDSLFALKGQRWRDMRATLSPAFTGAKMRLMVPFMVDISKQVVENLHREVKTTDEGKMTEPLDMAELFTRYTNDVIASCAFGYKIDSMKDKTNDFYTLGKAMTSFVSTQKIKFLVIKAAPRLAKILKFKFFPDTTTSFFRGIVSSTMKYREENNFYRPDMIQLLMEAKNGTLKYTAPKSDDGLGFATVEESPIHKESTHREWTEHEMAAQASLFFFAGFGTSSNALIFTAHELAVNPEIQKKLRAEVDLSHATIPELTYEVLQGLKYMDMVISETLRKWTAAPIIDRDCLKEYVLEPPREGAEPFIVKPNTYVYFLAHGLHMDEKVFPDPDKFDPERFSDERKQTIPSCAYLPFGSGPRNCIGSRFALMELKVILYQIMLDFELLTCSRTTNPIRLKRNFAMDIENGSWLKLKPRK